MEKPEEKRERIIREYKTATRLMNFELDRKRDRVKLIKHIRNVVIATNNLRKELEI